MTELDGLIAFLYLSIRDPFADGSPNEVYVRARGGRGPVLVCIRTVVVLNEAGQLSEVPNPPTHPLLSPPEHQRARFSISRSMAGPR